MNGPKSIWSCRDGEEAVFWSDVHECTKVCLELLGDPKRRKGIAMNGRRCCLANGYLNEYFMGRIVKEAL